MPRPTDANLRRSQGRIVPWLFAGMAAVVVFVGGLAWYLQRPATAPTGGRAGGQPAAEALELAPAVVRAGEAMVPSESDLAVLNRAVEDERGRLRQPGEPPAGETERLQKLEAMLAAANVRAWRAGTTAAEADARRLLQSNRREAAVARLREALELQRRLNQGGAADATRDLARENDLRQEIDRVLAEPVAAQLAAALAKGKAQYEQAQWPEALAAYSAARDLQLRLNREFASTQFANLEQLARIEVEIATVGSIGDEFEVRQNSEDGRAALAAGDSARAVALFARAFAAQRKINDDFPRSRFVSAAQLDTLEIERQTAASAPDAAALANVGRDLTAALRARDFGAAGEKIAAGQRLCEGLLAQFPRSRLLDLEARARFGFLAKKTAELGEIQESVAAQLAPLTGPGGRRMLRTEVTQELYARVMDSNPSRNVGPRLPVESVSENEAAEFCRRLNWVLGKSVRLPHEVEFRAALGRPEALAAEAAQACSVETSAQKSREVGAGPANAGGFYDLLGNVAEWLAPPDSAAATAPVAGGSYMDPVAGLARVPLEQWDRGARGRHVGFRFVVEDGRGQ